MYFWTDVAPKHNRIFVERGPAFDILIDELEYDGARDFLPENKYLSDNFAAAHALKTARGLNATQPDPESAQTIKAVLHRVVENQTPPDLKHDMDSVIERCGNYLSEYIKKRDNALKTLIDTMKAKPNDILASRNNYNLTYGTAASELETTPYLAPSFKPVKDISDEINSKLTNDVKGIVEADMEQPMKAAIKDASDHLSQDVALKSGAAGEKYGLDLLTEIKESLGPRQLYKNKNYGQTYESGAYELKKVNGMLEKETSNIESRALKRAIETELDKGISTKMSPHVQQGLEGAKDDAARHLSIVGQQKGDALEHIVQEMKKKDKEPLAKLRGQQQSHAKGAARIEAAHHLTADEDKVDKKGYDDVKQKLDVIAKDGPTETAKIMPDVVDEASKYLASKDPDWDKHLDGYSRAQGGVKGAGYGVNGVGTGAAETGDVGAGGSGTDAGTGRTGTGVYNAEAASPEANAPEAAGSAAADSAEAKGVGADVAKAASVDGARSSGSKAAAAATGGAGASGTDAEAKGAGADRAEAKATLSGADEAAAKATGAGFNRAGVKSPVSGTDETAAKTTGAGVEDAGAKRTGAGAGGTDVRAKGAGADRDGVKATRSRADEAAAKSTEAGADGTGAKETGTGADGTDAGAKESEANRARTKATGSGADRAAAKATGAGADGAGAKGTEAGADVARAKEKGATRPAGAGGAGAGVGGVGSVGASGTGISGADVGSDGVGVGSGARGKLAAGEQMSLEDEGRSGGRIRKRQGTTGSGAAGSIENDPDRAQAQEILHQQLKARGVETFYEQPRMSLTHSQASDWIKEPSRVDKATREAAETGRLANKFEKRLSTIVARHTPGNLQEPMLDVIIEDSQKLSERFVSRNYNVLARENLISEMQKKRNEILIEVDGAAETYFFAAQRLKKTQDLTAKEPCNKVSYQIEKSLDGIIRSRAIPRKLSGAMKEHIKATSYYLSEHVTKPDEQIEAYVALLNEMETAGDSPLIEGEIQKCHKESAAYLAQLTSYEDNINRPNAALQSSVETKLNTLMSNVPAGGYGPAVMAKVIKDSTRLLVSYITLQGERTEDLKVLTGEMEKEAASVLLRHGPVRKSYQDGVDLLRGKNTDQLSVDTVEPVVARKIQIKLKNLMSDRTPHTHKPIMEDVIEDATSYLAVNLLRPQLINVCKCMKNVVVQCELWCEEILRRVARPCCTCSRHVSVQALPDLAPSEHVTVTTGSTRGYAPGVEINVQPCPTKTKNFREPSPNRPCQAKKPTPGCRQVTSYLLYSQQYQVLTQDSRSTLSSSLPVRVGNDASARPSPTISPDLSAHLDTPSTFSATVSPGRSDENQSFQKVPDANESITSLYYTPPDSPDRFDDKPTREISAPVYIANLENWHLEDQPPQQHISNDSPTDKTLDKQHSASTSRAWRGLCDPSMSALRTPSYNARAPIIATEEMSDWRAMMVSLMWNVQAWREWIQGNIHRALAYKQTPQTSVTDETAKWMAFQRKVTTEAMQWRQYNNFSKRLSARLAVRYSNKQIMCPSRAAVITNKYRECQRETIKIIEMFNRWTNWLMAVVKETDSLKPMSEHGGALNEMQWSHFKLKVQEHAEDWERYNMHLKICWEGKYKSVILEWLPSEQRLGPVWVVSACGAVPSGAVAAGEYEGEVAWVARTTHKSSVCPAALVPSKHCCLVYANGGVHQYTKYQEESYQILAFAEKFRCCDATDELQICLINKVMCNASVSWVAWRAGDVGARAVRVAEGVYVGRVHYRGSHLLGAVRSPHFRCHVVIFGRQFAFSCYELLALADNAKE